MTSSLPVLLAALVALAAAVDPPRQQRIAIDGRDPYVAFISSLDYPVPRCISGLRIVADEPLTGAEEIDLLYSRCPWEPPRLVHYRNDEALFTFGENLTVSRLLIASRTPLRINGAIPTECTAPLETPCTMHGAKRKHRRHDATKILRVYDERGPRRKRQAPLQTFGAQGSPHVFRETLKIPAGQVLVISRGARLRFAPGTSVEVYGTLHVTGTEDAPVFLSALSGRWSGIRFIEGQSGSSLAHVNITGADGGIVIEEGAEAPSMQQVVVEGAVNGFTIQTRKDEPVKRITHATAAHNSESGFLVTGEVP